MKNRKLFAIRSTKKFRSIAEARSKLSTKIRGNSDAVASRFLLTYFVVGLLILSLAFIFYTKQIVELNQRLERQITPLASLASEIPSLTEFGLQDRLNEIVKQSLAVSRLSFLITDEFGSQIITARGIDSEIERKLNAEPPIALTDLERQKLNATLKRLRQSGRSKEIDYLTEDRKVYGYIYHGEADPENVDKIPFVFTDLNGTAKKWQIWGDLIGTDLATSQEKDQADRFIRSAENQQLFTPLQTKPDFKKGYFYYEKRPYYGLIAMPFILLGVFSTFLIGGFLTYRQLQKVEQTAIWCGLAKETAHQLGTPISSLMGWIELLESMDKSSIVSEACADMQKDLDRLQKIVRRFSKIGSQPEKTKVDVNQIIGDVVEYFEKRLPSRERQIRIETTHIDIPQIYANQELLIWVFENLVRNSLDAMDKIQGLIQIRPIYERSKNELQIRYSDNGKGIDRRDRNRIFKPGVTTKKHGWGLGLTLAKRIIEEYHHGKIRLIESNQNGTTFEISVPIEQN